MQQPNYRNYLQRSNPCSGRKMQQSQRWDTLRNWNICTNRHSTHQTPSNKNWNWIEMTNAVSQQYQQSHQRTNAPPIYLLKLAPHQQSHLLQHQKTWVMKLENHLVHLQTLGEQIPFPCCKANFCMRFSNVAFLCDVAAACSNHLMGQLGKPKHRPNNGITHFHFVSFTIVNNMLRCPCWLHILCDQLLHASMQSFEFFNLFQRRCSAVLCMANQKKQCFLPKKNVVDSESLPWNISRFHAVKNNLHVFFQCCIFMRCRDCVVQLPDETTWETETSPEKCASRILTLFHS